MRQLYRYIRIKDGLFPLIPFEVSSGERDYRNIGLIDSGARLSLFRKDSARELGLRIEEGSPIMLRGVMGLLQAYVHRLTVKVAGQEFLCDLCFSEEYTGNLNILGRKDFFEKFVISFDEKNHKFFLETEEVAPIE